MKSRNRTIINIKNNNSNNKKKAQTKRFSGNGVKEIYLLKALNNFVKFVKYLSNEISFIIKINDVKADFFFRKKTK